MKKLYIYLLSLLISTAGFANNIKTEFAPIIAVAGVPSELCTNEGFSVEYSTTGYTASGTNKFQVMLSENGTFSDEVNIAEITSTDLTGVIYVTIPYDANYGASYKIKVIGTAPFVDGTATAAININCTTRDYYWIGGNGDWSDFANHWEYTIDGSNFFPATEVPQTNDNANFDTNSFPSGGTLNFDQFIDINDFYWEPGSGSTSPSIQANGNTLKLKGELVLDAGVITQFAEIEYSSAKKYIEINYGDNILADPYVGTVSFDGGGSWDLNSEMNSGAILIHNASTFSTNDYQLNMNGELWANGNTNTINTGSSDIYLQGINTNDMLVTGNAIWHLNSGGVIARSISIGTVIIESGDYFIGNNVIIDELIMWPGSELMIRNIDPLSITSNFEAIGTRDKLINIKSYDPGVQATLSITPGASFTADFVAITDNIVTGDTDYIPTNWVDNGNNTGWDFDIFNKLTGLNYYWVGGTGNWSDYSAHWAKLPGGGGFRASAPGAVDNIIFTSASFPSGGTLTVDSDVDINTMDWQAGSGATSPRLRGSGGTITMTGDITFDNGVRRSVNFNFQSSLGQTQNLDFADNIYESGDIEISGDGDWELLTDLTTDRLNFNAVNGGAFNTNNHQLTAYRINILDFTGFYDFGTSIINISHLSNQTIGSPPVIANNATFNFGTSTSSYTTIDGGGFEFNLGPTTIIGEVSINGNSSINPNEFTSLTIEKGSVITLEDGQTQFVHNDFTAMGTRDQPITIKTSSPGNLTSFATASATSTSSFLIIEDVDVNSGTFDTDYSTLNGTAFSGGAVVNGWTFGLLLDTPLDFYWVGNSGNWSDFGSHWATSSDGSTMHVFAPGLGDNVFFTSNSFTIVGQAVTLDNPVSLNDMTWEFNSGLNSPTITALNDNSLTIKGELIMNTGVQRNINTLIFESAATQNIDLADNTGTFDYQDVIIFTGGGTWNLQSNFDTYQLLLEEATLNTNNFDFSVSNNINFASGSAVLNLVNSNAYLKNLNDNTGGFATINAATSSIFIDDNANLDGNFALNNVQVLAGGELSVGQSLSINNLVLDPGTVLSVNAGQTLTTNSFSAIGTSGSPIKIESNSSGSQGFISQSSGTIDATNILISDNDASGGATFNLANSLVIGNAGNVTGWNISATPTNQYRWIGGNGNWSDIAHWQFSIDGGASFNPAVSAPGMLDDVLFTTSSFTGPGERVEIDQNSYCHHMVWTTLPAQSPTLSGTFDIELTIFGSLILADGVKRGVQELNFESYVTGNIINMADNQRFGIFDGIDFRGTGEWTLMSDLVSQEVNFRGGTFNMNGFDLHVDDWSFNSGNPIIFNAGASHIYAGRFGNGNTNLDLTFNQGSSTLHLIDISNENSKINGPLVFNDVIIEAIDATINSSNAFNSLIVNDGVTLQLEDNTIQSIFDLSLNGLSGSPVIIESTNPGVQGTFNVPLSGSVFADYVIFTDNNAAGSATFNATNSSQISNVTGWSGLKQGQAINFLSLNDITLSETVNLVATASSGLTVTYSVTPLIGSASISTDVLTPSTVGLIEVVASQAGNGTYGPAQDVVQYMHLNEGIYANELGQMKEATIAVGAANGVSEGSYSFTDKSVANSLQAIVSPDGKLIVAGESRVMIWNEIPSTYDVPANVVVGQLDFTSKNLNPSQTILAPETNDFFTGAAAIGPNGELIVSDGRGVLIWDEIPISNGEPADVIIGQANFTATAMEAAQDKFLAPVGVAVSNDGKLIVADAAANRVLIFNTIPTANGALADVVIGQPNFTSSAAGTSDQSLSSPAFVSVSPDNKLLITDLFNNRVLVYNSIPTANNALADVVIGQDDFTTSSTGLAGNAFNIPMGVAVSKSGKLAITDLFNSRVLIYNQIPANNNTLADLVLGQPDLNTSEPVNEDQISLRDISFPFGVSWDLLENLLISDTQLARVLVYGAADLTAPSAFTTGVATVTGGGSSLYWNAGSTSIDVSVPLDNDLSLEGGTIQLQVKIGAGAFENIGSNTTILNTDLSTSKLITITSTDLQDATDYLEGESVSLRAVLTDIVTNQTTGTPSATTLTIDTNAPTAATTGAVTTVGGTIVAGIWNSTNTSVDIIVPVDNDVTIDGGKIQLQVKIGTGSFVNISGPKTILNANLGNSQTASVTEAEFKAVPGYLLNATAVFRAIVSDVAGNQTTFSQSSTSLVINDNAPLAFTTGATSTVSGMVVSGYWNASNTSINVEVPIDNDPLLDGGTIQLQASIDASIFEDIGIVTNINTANLGGSLIVSITDTELTALTGYAENGVIAIRAILTNNGGNATVGSESNGTFTIDTTAPIAFTIDNITTVDGSVVAGVWNNSNTSIDLNIPIDNDVSLTGGTIQLQVKFGTGLLENIGVTSTILGSELGLSNTVSITKTEFESATGYLLGETAEFNAIMYDIAGNQSIGTLNGTTLLVDNSTPPNAFITGSATIIGGVINSSYLNASNTDLEIIVPIENDATLDGGSVQMQAKFGSGIFTNIGATATIADTDLGSDIVITINKLDIEASTDFAQGEIVSFQAIIGNNVGSQTIGTASSTTFIIDTVVPNSYDTGTTITTVGGNVVAGTWNNSNTGIDIVIPIANDASLTDGTIQITVDVDGGGFVNLGSAVIIPVESLNMDMIVSLNKTDIDGIAGTSNGAVLTFNSIISDIASNSTVGAPSTTTITIDNSAPNDFTTGNVSPLGGLGRFGYWNSTNTGLEVSVPIENNIGLVGGSIQIWGDVDEVGFEFIASAVIEGGSLGFSQLVTITKAELETLPNFNEGSEVRFTASLTDLSTNTTVGTESLSKIIVDRVAPTIDTGSGTTLVSTYSVGGPIETPKIRLIDAISGIDEFIINYNLVSSMLHDEYNQDITTPDQDGDVLIEILSFIQSSSEQVGLKYYVTITDNAGNTFSTIDNEAFINFEYPDGVTWNKFGVGTASNQYKIMAVPLDLDNAAVEHVFSSIYGGSFDNTKMRIWSYTGGDSYAEATKSTSLSLGKGYFALAAASSDIKTPKGTTSFRPIQNSDGDDEQGFIITLANGWNMIGNPFLHDVKWSDIKELSGFTDSDINNLQTYNGGWITTGTDIKVGEGAFVFNETGSTYSLKIPARTAVGGRIAQATTNTNSLAEVSWEVLFKADQSNGNHYIIGGVGMEETANYDKDEFDLLNPPAFASMKLMDFNHPAFLSPSFKKDIRATNESESWRFEYRAENDEEKQRITWDNSYFGDNSPDLFLLDKTHFTTINMKEVNTYSFSHTGTTQFEVHFGYDLLNELLPDDLITQSPFPNPFTNEISFNIGLPDGGTSSIQIKIFDSLGKLIADITNTDVESGYNSIVWDGLNKDGAKVPVGLYAYSIHVKSATIDIVKNGKIIKK